jgi:hypothetical protein
MGWSFMSDDIAPVRMSANEVLAFPQSPFRRIGGTREVDRADARKSREGAGIDSSRVDSAAARTNRSDCVSRLSSESESTLVPMASGNAAFELLRSYTNFIDHKESGVARASELARQIPAYQLIYSQGIDAAALLNSSLRADAFQLLHVPHLFPGCGGDLFRAAAPASLGVAAGRQLLLLHGVHPRLHPHPLLHHCRRLRSGNPDRGRGGNTTTIIPHDESSSPTSASSQSSSTFNFLNANARAIAEVFHWPYGCRH